MIQLIGADKLTLINILLSLTQPYYTYNGSLNERKIRSQTFSMDTRLAKFYSNHREKRTR
jgi:hypothetical protein